jgi:ribonuclease HII
MIPNLKEEKKLWKRGFKRIAGIDEAGRGPLAGPVFAAAVIIKPAKLKIKNSKFKILLREVKDSKKLTPQKREKLYHLLIKNPDIEWGIGEVSEKVIDKINIKNAAELAMEKAVRKLNEQPDFLIIDGKYLKNKKLKSMTYKLIIKADEKVFSCSCASIIAKVARDRIMDRYHEKYPRYGFKKHKGYPTRLHFKMLKKHGPCKIHRKTFWPVKLYYSTY